MFGSHSKANGNRPALSNPNHRRQLIGSALVYTLLAGAAPSVAQESDPATHDEVPAIGTLTREPELLHFVEADFPPEALAAKQTGAVELVITIEVDGRVSSAVIQTPAGHGFDEAALTAVRQFTFQPAEIDGVPAPVQIVYRYEFTLDEQIETVPAPADHPTGALRGTLLERGTRNPLAGVLIRVGPHTIETLTDADGHFEILDVPAGEITVLITDDQYYEIEDAEEIRAGQVAEVKYYLERSTVSAAEITVVGRRAKKEVVRRTLSVEEIRTLPGTNGDALKVVQNLPGAARIPFNGGDFILRGGGWSATYVNRHPINRAFHFGGLRSTVNSELIESIDIYPGNYGAEYGHVNGGIVDIRIRQPKTDRIHGYVEADIFDTGLLLEGPLTEHSSFAIGGRRSYIDGVLPLVLDDEQMESFSMAPRYYDFQAVYDYRAGRHTFRTMFFGSNDSMVMLIDEPPENEPDVRGSFKYDQDWYTVQSFWDFEISDRMTNHLSASMLFADELQSIGDDFNLDVGYQIYTLREDLDVEVEDWLTVRGGADLAFWQAQFEVTAPMPPREGEPQMPLSVMERLHVNAKETYISPSLWSEMQIELGPVLLVPALRLDYVNKIEALALLPRLTTRYTVIDGTVLKGGFGLYNEWPDADQIDDTFGNPELTMKRSVHYSLGVEQQITEALSIDLTGFYKDFDDLIVKVDDPAVKLTNDGDGRAYGLEVLLRHALHSDFYGWVAYTLMRSERREGSGEPSRLFDFDQTHNITVVGQYRITPTWEVGLRWRYVTGNPQTPYSGGSFDSDADVYVGRPGEINSDRLPAFHQLDLRIDKHWVFDWWRMTTYLDVQNVYNRQNPELYQYNFDYSQKDTVNGLPIIPSFGIRGEF